MTAQPFKIAIPDDAVDLLKEKLHLTRLPDELDEAGWEYGAPLADIRRLLGRWKNGYDWRKHEKALNNELPQFTRDIEVDGHGVLNIHYVYKRSSVANAIPLLFVHGWPGSFLEVRKILPLLTGPNLGSPSFHVVAISLPSYGFSEGPRRKGFGVDSYAEVSHKLMIALGYDEYVTQGGDWGYFITRIMATRYGGQHVKAWHSNLPVAPPPSTINPEELTPAELASLSRIQRFTEKGVGFLNLQSTQPQTIGYSLADSPIGLLAWIYEKLVIATDAYPWDDDEVLTWISIYWFSRAGPAASVRIYYEAGLSAGLSGFAALVSTPTTIPFGLSYFPQEILSFPKSWFPDTNIVFVSRHDRGGHFAAYEVPNEFVNDLRRMFGRDGPAYGVITGKDGYA